MDPIRPIGHDDSIHAVERMELQRIHHESDEEAAERRRQQAQDRERERQREALAKGEPLPAVPGKPAFTPAEAADDGHPHCDFRV